MPSVVAITGSAQTSPVNVADRRSESALGMRPWMTFIVLLRPRVLVVKPHAAGDVADGVDHAVEIWSW